MQRVLILGATSAVAAEVATLYAARGDQLVLVGRNPEKLALLTARLAHAHPVAFNADFDNLEQNEKVVAQAIAALGGLDIALIAHGDLGNQLESEQHFSAAERTLRTNLLGAIALIVPLANYFEEQRRGSLAVITSVAGERGRPRNYTYGAAKGALNIYLQGARSRLYRAGVHVTCIKLGPVDTPMTTDHPKTALFAKPKGVAQSIVAAIDRGAGEVRIPWFWNPIMVIVTHLPEAIFQKFAFLSGR